MSSSAAELGQAPGTQGAATSGQHCRDSCAQEQLLCITQQGWGHDLQVQREVRELTGCVACKQTVSSLEEHFSQPLTR